MNQPQPIASTDKLKHPISHLRRPIFPLILLVLVLAIYLVVSTVFAPRKPEHLIPQVIQVYPHDTSSFIEGLIWHDGFLYESSGLYGQSNLRKVDLETGTVLQRVDDPPSVFGEGIALRGDQLFQLTWREKTGYIYKLSSLDRQGTISYDGEGWGLCFDGQYFFMSDGSSSISKREPKTFAVVSSIQVLQEGKPIDQLNELECVGNSIYANVWKTNTILQINKASGKVTGVVDASDLLTPEEAARAGPEGVLNGIAYDPADDVFFITGKLWPKLFKVKFVPGAGTG
jgi:glutaminyl-peptide cyclotransferase